VLRQVIEITINPEVAIERIKRRNRGTDDDINLFNDRMSVYNAEIDEIREFYTLKGIFNTINGEGSPENTAREIASIILE
jgi:adenylate kinase